MAITIPVAHDFNCPWCYVGLLQVKRLQQEFGARIEWRGYELYPAHIDWPDYPKGHEYPANRPPTLNRLQFLLHADNVEIPHIDRPKKQRTYNAHQAAEYAKTEHVQDALIERIYRAYWEQGLNINDIGVLRDLATGIVSDLDAMEQAIRTKRFAKNIVHFDDDAHANGVYNVPTYFIGGQRLAEMPYGAIRKAVEEAIREHGGVDAYLNLAFPEAPKDRPYTFINMVTTIDGKILTGKRDESVHDLGSKTDHKLMKRIEAAADAVILGANSLRATPPSWNPNAPIRIVVTKSGNLPHHAKFFEGESYVATSGSAQLDLPANAKILRAGNQDVDFRLLLEKLRAKGIRRLLVLGGSELNAQLLREDLIDELFLTLAPKIKLGRDVPTYADGIELPRQCVQDYEVVEQHLIGNEIFARYRRVQD